MGTWPSKRQAGRTEHGGRAEVRFVPQCPTVSGVRRGPESRHIAEETRDICRSLTPALGGRSRRRAKGPRRTSARGTDRTREPRVISKRETPCQSRLRLVVYSKSISYNSLGGSGL